MYSRLWSSKIRQAKHNSQLVLLFLHLLLLLRLLLLLLRLQSCYFNNNLHYGRHNTGPIIVYPQYREQTCNWRPDYPSNRDPPRTGWTTKFCSGSEGILLPVQRLRARWNGGQSKLKSFSWQQKVVPTPRAGSLRTPLTVLTTLDSLLGTSWLLIVQMRFCHAAI